MPSPSRDARRAITSQRILAAAQEEFASSGFDGATIRSIADRAGVHASLVMQHFGTKAALFASAVQLPSGSDQLVSDHLVDVLDVRMRELPPETRALVRSMLTVPEVQAVMRDFLDERVDNLATSIEGEDARLRATLIVSSILGLTIARHFLELKAFDGLSNDSLVAVTSAWVNSLSAPVSPPSMPGGPSVM